MGSARQLFVSAIGVRGPTRIPGRFVVHQDAMGIPVKVIELATAGGPEQDHYRHQAKDEHSGNQAVDDFHGAWTAQLGSRRQRSARNRPWIRAELPITARELSGMEIAATSGVTRAAMASGTMMTL